MRTIDPNDNSEMHQSGTGFEKALHLAEAAAKLNTFAEMPKYLCHKEVWALKIVDVTDANEFGCRVLLFAEPFFAPKAMDAVWCAKHEPRAGGYFVVYEDGYQSYSPGPAFEAGYRLIKMPEIIPGSEIHNAKLI